VGQIYSAAPLAGASHGTGSKQYLTFRVARKDFAIEAAHVRGILPLRDLFPARGAPAEIAGFTNFAGRMLAVIDLGERLSLGRSTRGSQPRIVVVEHPGGQFAGFIADRVSDVVAYRGRDIRNCVLHGYGRPRRVIGLETLVAGDEFPLRAIFAG
jgi:chemotaxis signal transduction protein